MDKNHNPFREKDENELNNEQMNNEEINQETNKNNEEISKEENSQNENNSNTIDENETNPENEETSSKEDNTKTQLEDLNNKYLRLAADFDNFRKRTQQEKEELSKYACADLLKKITTVLDTFDRAQEHLKDIEDCKVVKDSYEVAFKQLIDTLKKAGLEEIEALGKPFDPNEHEAIAQVPNTDFEPDTIAYVAQKGYKMNDKIIRPALVGVAKKADE